MELPESSASTACPARRIEPSEKRVHSSGLNLRFTRWSPRSATLLWNRPRTVSCFPSHATPSSQPGWEFCTESLWSFSDR